MVTISLALDVVHFIALVPALNVRVTGEVEEWRDGRQVSSRFHERYEAFVDHHVTLNPEEHRVYELPAIEGWALIVTVLASCSNGPDDSAYFVVGEDRSALHHVAYGNGKKRAVKRLKSRGSTKSRGSRELRFAMDLTSLKDYEKLFGDKA